VSSAILGLLVDAQLVRKWEKVVKLFFQSATLASAGPRPIEMLVTQVGDTVLQTRLTPFKNRATLR